MGHRVWLLLILLGGVSSEAPTMYGEITSPNYPQGYPNNAQNSWEITVPKGFGIKIYFLHLDIEPSENCEYDFVQIIVGDQVEGKFCGRKTDPSLPSIPVHELYFPTNNLTLQFTSDFSNEERYTGFSAHYIAMDVDECDESSEIECSHFCNNYIGGYFCSCHPGYFLHPNNHTCGVQCSGNLFTDLRGQINSPGYPSNYPENSLCEYKVHLSPGYQVILTFQTKVFDIEAGEDGSCIYDTLTIQVGGRTFGPYCGKSPPPQIETGSNEVTIIFQTDSGGDHKGWRINYSEDAIPCDHLVFQHSLLNPRKNKYVFKDTVTVTCQEGYEFVTTQLNMKSMQSTCQDDGTWSVTEPTCTPVDCGHPNSIDNGSPIFSQTTYLSEATYICDSDFYKLTLPPSGDDTFVCSAKGDWVGKSGGDEIPKCKAVCGVCSTGKCEDGIGRIFGGNPAEPGQFPWQIAFISPSRGSGALISDRWILTAAHVVQDKDSPEMYGGVINLRPKKQENLLKAKKIIVHPNWVTQDNDKRVNYNHDIALVLLCSKVKLGSLISPICLPGSDHGMSPTLSQRAYIAGWGATEKKERTPHLLFTIVALNKNEKCQELDKEKKYTYTSNMLCAGDATGHDSCKGDSGGPLMFFGEGRMYTAGITSWGVNCGKFGVYTKVENYLDWIKETMERVEMEEDGSPDPECA
ncbi:complement C1s subcomponent [Pelobates cultripes]|uniref:Complement C1s subcomponent n=2 Tax=Pelobates cultripes TaxID=61616 RepID=A0AAD1TDT7_PELCU|nr:complement C1s subcomponent [Pelobates cultripes]